MIAADAVAPTPQADVEILIGLGFGRAELGIRGTGAPNRSTTLAEAFGIQFMDCSVPYQTIQ